MAKKRKTSPRNWKGPPNPEQSKKNRERWADPIWRAETIAKSKAGAAKARAEGRGPSRSGVPDGMRKEQAKWFWRQARFEATLTMKKLEAAGVLTEADEQAREALHYAITVMRGPTQQKDGLAAARLVLDFTKSKPAQKQEVSITKAEEWLDAVTKDNGEATNEGATGGA